MLRRFLAKIVICLFAASASAAELHLLAAASLTDALTEIVRSFERETGAKVYLSLGASSILARQIEEGAPADLFLSADEQKMDRLAELGLIRKETRRNLLSNSLVIVTAGDSSLEIHSAHDLTKARRIAMAETSTVPAGIYGREYLEQAGVWPAVKNRIIPTENVRGALAAVESGNVDAGIVYKTDAAISKKVRVACQLPAGSPAKISYPVAVTSETRNLEVATRFLKYLQSETSRMTFEKFGFIVQNTE